MEQLLQSQGNQAEAPVLVQPQVTLAGRTRAEWDAHLDELCHIALPGEDVPEAAIMHGWRGEPTAEDIAWANAQPAAASETRNLIVQYQEAIDRPETTPLEAKALRVNMRALENLAARQEVAPGPQEGREEEWCECRHSDDDHLEPDWDGDGRGCAVAGCHCIEFTPITKLWCKYCGPDCLHGASHNARAEDECLYGDLPGETATEDTRGENT